MRIYIFGYTNGMTVDDITYLLKALSDEARLRILALLNAAPELCVCDLEKTLQFSQTKVSRHLSYLKRAGLVQSRRHGVWMYYALVEQENAQSKELLQTLLALTETYERVREDRSRLTATLQTPC